MSLTITVDHFSVGTECAFDEAFFADVLGEISQHFERFEATNQGRDDITAWCEAVESNLDAGARALIRALAKTLGPADASNAAA